MLNGSDSREEEYERLWVQIVRTRWSSLAIVPADPSIDVERVARSLVDAGTRHQGDSVQYVDARSTKFTDVHTVADTISSLTGAGRQIVLAVDAVLENPSVIPIIRATSGVLLVVRAGQSTIESTRSTVEAIGQDRVMGSVFLS